LIEQARGVSVDRGEEIDTGGRLVLGVSDRAS
jgi:hypothetical protein